MFLLNGVNVLFYSESILSHATELNHVIEALSFTLLELTSLKTNKYFERFNHGDSTVFIDSMRQFSSFSLRSVAFSSVV